MWGTKIYFSIGISLIAIASLAAQALTPEGLHPTFKMNYYNVFGSNWSEIATAIFDKRPTINGTNQRFEGITYSDMVLEPRAECSSSGARLNVSLEVDVPRLASSDGLSDTDQECWANYDRGLTDHEEGHIQIAMHDAEETLAEIRAATNASCGGLQQIVARHLGAMRREQAEYDTISDHGLVQWKAWGKDHDPDPDRAALDTSCTQRARAKRVAN